jgi:hypothetical protein
MKTLAKILIVSSVICFVVSLTGPGSEFLWGFLKPLSALLFVNFFIMNLLAREYSKYDQEYDLRMKLACAKSAAPPQASSTTETMVRRPQFAH